MDTLWIMLIAAAGAWALAYFRAPVWVWSLLVAGGLVAAWTWLSGAPGLTHTLAWLAYLVIALPITVPALRRALVTKHILPLFRAAVPHMSQTEAEALDAGTVWWDGELFSGRPRWKHLLELPTPRLSDEEQAFVDGPVQQLCEMLDDWQITEELHDLPPQVWRFVKENGFFGMIIPKEYGGLGFSALAHSAVVMKIAGRSISAAVTVMVPNSLGPAELLLRYGTKEQRDHYLPRLARGQEIPCFALTGPEAGSDASAMPDIGVVCKQMYKGKETLGIRLNWEKRYITLGPVATVLGLAFKLHDPGHLLGGKENLGITLALIPTDTPGVQIGRRHFPLNAGFQNGPNWGKDVFIPLDWVIGGEERVGQGWRMLMECLAAGRSISLPSLSVGAGKLVCRATGAYARVRKQFKTPIGRFEGVEEVLARMAGYTYMMDSVRMVTAAALDSGEEPSVLSAIAKYNLTERMRQVVNDAMDVQGGTGICMGPRNLLARMYQSIPISITVEGANILTRTLIIFGQGAVRCHPYILKEMQAALDSDQKRGLKQFDAAFFGHVGFLISNMARSLFIALTASRLVRSPERGAAAYYYRQATRMSAAFALAADLSMLTLGGSLKRREKLSGRLADVLSHLYLISATLKRYADDGSRAEDLPLLRWSCDQALFAVQQAFDGLLRNFPFRPFAWLMRALIFPLGRPYSPPADDLGRQAAEALLTPSSLRDRLTAGMYLTDDPQQQLGRLETGLGLVVASEEAEQKLRRAVRSGALADDGSDNTLREAVKAGVITEDEADCLRKAIQLRKDVVKVDDFAAERWQKPASQDASRVA